ncbi:MAG TPA: DUF6174 domain-containing protein [Gemmatimonadales bacterium]|nr:DUF6174 domain-containing protein [Gemmatimonadales bacterium]
MSGSSSWGADHRRNDRRVSQSRIALLVVLLVAPIPACSEGPLSPGQRHQLELARARWARGGSSDYTVESRIACFCPPHLSYWTRLTVRAGQIISTEPVEPLPDGIESSTLGWQTVDEVFAVIGSLDSDMIRAVTLRFDPVLGYPLEVRITCHENIQDCGVVREMRSLQLP